MIFTEMHVKGSVTFGRLGPEILTALEIKGQVKSNDGYPAEAENWLYIKLFATKF